MENEKLHKLALSMLITNTLAFAVTTYFLIEGAANMTEWVLCVIGEIGIGIPVSIRLLKKTK